MVIKSYRFLSIIDTIDKRTILRIAIGVPVVALSLVGLLTILYAWSTGAIHRMVDGPKVVMSVVSADGQFEAYVVDRPSLDPPEHKVFIEQAGQIRFLPVTKTFGGVGPCRGTGVVASR